MKKNKPPKFLYLILRRLTRYENKYMISSDFGEEYSNILEKEGKIRATSWYSIQLFVAIYHYLTNLISRSWTMLKNYFLFTIRTIQRNKVYSAINILGLAISLAFFVKIVLYTEFETSFDTFHRNSKNIYRINQDTKIPSGVLKYSSVPVNIGPLLKRDFPEIKSYVRLIQPIEPTVKYEDTILKEEKFVFADSTLFSVFDFDMIEGNGPAVLKDPGQVIITEKTAERYFGTENPIGKRLTYTDKRFGTVYDFIVGGVMKNPPKNSHITFDFLGPMVAWDIICRYKTGATQLTGDNWWVWLWNPHNTYLLLNENASSENLAAGLPGFIDRVLPENLKTSVEYSLISLADIHTKSDRAEAFEPPINERTLYILMTLAIFILVISAINYMNLSTSRSLGRAKEIGMRKVFGAKRPQLIKQFMFESVFVTLLAAMIAVFVIQLTAPYFNSMTGKDLDVFHFSNTRMLTYLISISIIVGLFSGVYPALVLSAFKPIQILQSMLSGSRKNSSLRKVLVVVQFSISTILICSTMLIYKQIHFLNNKSLGYNKENLLYISLADGIQATEAEQQKYQAFRNELLRMTTISEVATVDSKPGVSVNAYYLKPEGIDKNETLALSYIWADEHFLDLYELELLEKDADFLKGQGRIVYIINEQAVKKMGWNQPLGKRIDRFANGRMQWTGTVKGVVKDFNFEPLYKPIDPLVIAVNLRNTQSFGYVVAKVQTDGLQDTMGRIEKQWKEMYSDKPFDYFFLDENLNQNYQAEEKLGNILMNLTSLGILISCLGLFSLSSLLAQKRTKEIGIRKVLGSSVGNLIYLLSREFVILAFYSAIIALPLAYLAVRFWLQKFAYQTDIGWAVFMIAVVLLVVISLSTVSFHSLRTAFLNPVKTLRYE